MRVSDEQRTLIERIDAARISIAGSRERISRSHARISDTLVMIARHLGGMDRVVTDWKDEQFTTGIESRDAQLEQRQIDHEIQQTSAEKDYAPLEGKPGL